MAELKFDIGAIVDITLAVSEKVRAKDDMELELVNDELAEANAEIERLQAQIEELAGQKDRQSKRIMELTDTRDRQVVQIDGLKKELEEWRVGMPPRTDEELQKKLDKAMDHIRRQGEEIDKLRAGAADPRWIPMSEKRPCGGATVIVCTKRGVVDVATETMDGWKRSTGKMAEPVAWMPLPVKFTGGEE